MRKRIVGTAAAMALTAAGAVPAPHLAKGLEAGAWELRARGEEGDVQRLCIADLRQLLQVRHGRAQCKSFTVSDAPNRLIVTYDCGIAGNGRTDLRVETPRLAQIQSQGIADGAPFADTIEARWAGACR